MFTGVIEETGMIEEVQRTHDSAVLAVKCSKVLNKTKVGDSISVNGVCLTVTALQEGLFFADVMPETLRRTSLSEAGIGSKVNLERALPSDGRFGGHIVSGHIDGVAQITEITEEENATWYTVRAADTILHYIVEKGSVAIDGISLTVAAVQKECFQVSVIPHTKRETNLKDKKVGNKLNIETDMIGKYIEKFLAGKRHEQTEEVTAEFLIEHGF